MATIALNWELGADLGHIGRFLPIALRFKQLGHRPVLLLRDISRADALLTPHGLEYLQAPVWSGAVSGLPPDINFTETLFRFGYLHPPGLLSMCRAWRAQWGLLRPALMLFDHAPTALLAARGYGVPRVLVGNSFAIPPAQRPLPRYRWWLAAPGEDARLAETEQRATHHANRVLGALQAPPIGCVADIYAGEASFITGRPALDVYGPRAPDRYVGPVNNVEHGAPPQWPPGDTPALFAYLKPNYPHFEAVLDAMARTPARFLVFAPGMAERLKTRHAQAALRFSDVPLRMRDVVAQCHAVICHAGGVTDVALEAGKPLLLLPTQMEQTMTSQRVEALGAGITLARDGNPANLGKLLKRLITDATLTARAAEYAAAARSGHTLDGVTRIVDACVALLAGQAHDDSQPGQNQSISR
jgi:UDP:flavonoid glycosyltransferase YjiC (YdhE family)